MVGTGNETCDKLMNIDFNGNVIHSLWFKTIVKENGKADLVAINILADIVYWYRPTPVRDEESGKVIGYRKKFKADLLQRNYDSYADQFGLSKRQVADAFSRLEKLGIIQRVFRTLNVNGMLINNVLHIDLNYDGLIKYSTEEIAVDTVSTPVPKKRDPYHEISGEGSRKNVIGLPKKRDTCPEKKGYLSRNNVTPITSNGDTNTETITNTTTKTLTKNNNNNGAEMCDKNEQQQKFVVVVELLKKYGATENKAVELVHTYGVDSVQQKLYLLSQQNNISNAVGFVIQALREDYQDARIVAAEQALSSRTEAKAKNERLREESLKQHTDEPTEQERKAGAISKANAFQGIFCVKYNLKFEREHPSVQGDTLRNILVDIFLTEKYPTSMLQQMVNEYFNTRYDHPHDLSHFLSADVFSCLIEKANGVCE